MKRLAKMVFSVCLLFLFVSMAAAEETESFEILGNVEKTLYGHGQTGGLIQRLGKAEQDLFGRELPGSVAQRQQALLDFIEKGSDGQPSFLFKLGVAEWVTAHKANPEASAVDRIARLEGLLKGDASGAEGPLTMRLERVLETLLGDSISWEEVTVPLGTVMRVELVEALSPKTAKAGDPVLLRLNRDVSIEERLIAPQGSLVNGVVDSVNPPRSFGRPAEVNVKFVELLPLGYNRVPVTIGERARQAAKNDKAVMAAAGASFLGLVIFGPIGLVGGLFVRGEDKDVPAGTPFYVEAAEEIVTQGYAVPEDLRGFLSPNIASDDVPEPTPTPTPRVNENK